MTTTHAFAIGARTWADGFGRWHVAIPDDRNGGTGLILDARQCILEELVLREQKTGETEHDALARLVPYVLENVARRRDSVTLPGFVEFIEYDIDGDTDPEPDESDEPPVEPSSWRIGRSVESARPIALHHDRGNLGTRLDLTLDDLRTLAGLLATFDLSGSAASQHYMETGELLPLGDAEHAYSELANGRISVEEAQRRGAFAPPAPDYADAIAARVYAARVGTVDPVSAAGTLSLMAAAAREGYALGFGAAQ